MTDSLDRWEIWFNVVGGESLKEWEAAKQVSSGHELISWANIIELNRIDKAIKDQKSCAASSSPAEPDPASAP